MEWQKIKVTGVKAGTTVATATSEDGDYTAKIFQSTLVVEVVDNGRTFSAKYSIEKKNNYICRIEYQRYYDKYSIELEHENGKKCQVL